MASSSRSVFVDDYDHAISSLIYSPTCVPGPGSDFSEFESQLLGCKCTESEICLATKVCQASHMCCLNYTLDKVLIERKWLNDCIVECNSQCACSTVECSNRVVQFGPRKNLEVFLASPEKGYGLKTNKFIPKGAFICEYAGELIGIDEARRRFRMVSSATDMNYIFVLREMVSSAPTSSHIETIVDPTFIGNIGRYINHSCDPNSGIIPVRIDSPVPRLGIFSKRDISPEEEITYNYSGACAVENNGSSTGSGLAGKRCHCGSQICQGSLPCDESLL